MKSITLNRQRLAACRERLGITKQEAAKRMQMSQPAYLRYESGERTPSIHTIKIMAEVLGTSAAYLTGQTDLSSPDSYTIHLENEPELFQLIELYRNAVPSVQNKLLTYIMKLNEKL